MVKQEYTQVFEREDLQRAIARLIDRIERRLRGSGLTLVSANKTSVHTRLQAIFNDKPQDALEQSVHEIMMTHAIMAEKMGPGGFDACLKIVINDLRQIAAGCNLPDRAALLERLKTYGGKQPRRSDITKLIDAYTSDASNCTREMLKKSMTLAGFGGRIIVEKSLTHKPSIELVSGYAFDLDTAWPLTTAVKEPRVAVIDGYVESVGELNAFLEHAHSSKEPVCLFVCGLAPDVISTLRVNYDRGTLMVIPVIVKFDVEGINVLKDIAIVAGCDVVSTAKGDLITTIAFDACPRIDCATISNSKVVLFSHKTKTAVQQHVAALCARRTEQQEALGQLLDARIRALSPNHVVMRLPDDRDFVRNAQAVDNALRSAGAAISHGIVDNSGISDIPCGAPMGTVVGAVFHASVCVKRLLALGAAIVQI